MSDTETFNGQDMFGDPIYATRRNTDDMVVIAREHAYEEPTTISMNHDTARLRRVGAGEGGRERQVSDNYVALEAQLDRMAASARDRGEKIEITEFEAVVLATLADIGAVALLTNWRDGKERGRSMRALDKAGPILRSLDLDPNDIAMNGAAIVRVGRLAEYNALAPDDVEGSNMP